MQPPFPALSEFLPHRPPMLLLRAVLAHDPDQTICEGWFDEAFARACGGEVSAAFGLELIAQASAVHHSLRRHTEGVHYTVAPKGLLLGSRRLTLGQRCLPVGVPLQVTVRGGGQNALSAMMVRYLGQVASSDGDILVEGDVTVMEVRPETQIV